MCGTLDAGPSGFASSPDATAVVTVVFGNFLWKTYVFWKWNL
jgi:hypothetical protein